MAAGPTPTFVPVPFLVQAPNAPAPWGATAQGTKATTTAASSAIANTETLVLNYPLLAGTQLKVGSLIQVTLCGTCTTTAAGVGVVTIRAGTAGTVADQSVGTVTLPAAGTTGTNIPFVIVITFNVQTVGATGTAFGTAMAVSNATGIIGAATAATAAFAGTNLATTTATFLDVSYTSGNASTASTFGACAIEVTP